MDLPTQIREEPLFQRPLNLHRRKGGMDLVLLAEHFQEHLDNQGFVVDDQDLELLSRHLIHRFPRGRMKFAVAVRRGLRT